MTYDEAIEAVARFEGVPVAVDTIINKPAPGTKAGLQDDHRVGVLELRDIPVPGDTPADEAVWWFRREGKAVVGIAGIDPDGGFLVSRDRFRGAHWEDTWLLLNTGGISWRIVPLLRSDGQPLAISSSGSCEGLPTGSRTV